MANHIPYTIGQRDCLCLDSQIKTDYDGGEKADYSVNSFEANSISLLRRLNALNHTLKTDPKQARRLARIMA